MVKFKTGFAHYDHIVDNWPATRLLAIQTVFFPKTNCRNVDYYAFGSSTLRTGILFTAFI